MTFKERRLKLHTVLKTVLGSNNVYYVPPKKPEYPCFIYRLSKREDTYADNSKYQGLHRWTITHVDPNPDSNIGEEILKIPYTAFENQYLADGLTHTVYVIYF